MMHIPKDFIRIYSLGALQLEKDRGAPSSKSEIVIF